MSAQFESSVKRTQNGFASRSDLLAARLYRSNYKGIKSIFDRGYGGFLSTFSHGSEPARLEGVARDLGTTWQTSQISIKPYPCMAGIHAQIDCIRGLQQSER
jgi:2-methylcitrate dehydratase PrpD